MPDFDEPLIERYHIGMVVYDAFWMAFPLTKQIRPSLSLLSVSSAQVISGQPCLLVIARNQGLCLIADVKRKFVVAEQELVLHSVHGQRL